MPQLEKQIDCLFVTSPGTYVGGAERYVQYTAVKLQDLYKRHVVISVSHNTRFSVEVKRSGVPSVYLGGSVLEASTSLAQLIKINRPKIVVSNGYHSAYVVFLTALRLGIRKKQVSPFLVDIKHGWIKVNLKERFKTALDQSLARLFDLVVVVNPAMKQELTGVEDHRLTFVPSGVEISRNGIFVNGGSADETLKVLLVGRLSQEKRFELVVQALSEIKDWPWRLSIVGDGSEAQYLKLLAHQLGVTHRVCFNGYQQNVRRFFKQSDLLVISSLSEGCPLVALEAMASHVTVLSTDVGYMTTLLRNERGFLVSKNIDSKMLADKIRDIMVLTDEQINAIRHKAFDYVYHYHNVEKTATAFNAIISKAL